MRMRVTLDVQEHNLVNVHVFGFFFNDVCKDEGYQFEFHPK